MDLKQQLVIKLHGNDVGTEDYFTEISCLSDNLKNVSIDKSFYNNNDHYNILLKNDISLCLYKNENNDINWNKLLFSSGKIATSLWAGLAVLTNIKSEHTLYPPFIFIGEINYQNIKNALNKYKNNKLKYYNSAISFAEKYYNLDTYMDEIMDAINT